MSVYTKHMSKRLDDAKYMLERGNHDAAKVALREVLDFMGPEGLGEYIQERIVDFQVCLEDGAFLVSAQSLRDTASGIERRCQECVNDVVKERGNE